jgi:hypothetical protein
VARGARHDSLATGIDLCIPSTLGVGGWEYGAGAVEMSGALGGVEVEVVGGGDG